MKDLETPEGKPAVKERKPATNPRVLPPVGPAGWTRIHSLVLGSFMLVFMLPALLVASYMFLIAHDQYVSEVSFVVRDEESPSLGLLAGIGLSSVGNTTTDAQIVYKHLRSPNFVAQLDREIDLRAIYTKPRMDPVFALHDGASLEELVDYWRRMVTISVDSATGMIEIEVRAFTAEDANLIAQGIHKAAGRLVNAISDEARENSLRYAQRDLAQTEERLAEARVALAQFRDQSKLIDPQSVLSINASVVTGLSQELTEAMLQVETLRKQGTADVRLTQAELRVDVLKRRIEQERQNYVGTAPGDASFSKILDRYTKLQLDLELAEKSYSLALSGVEAARSKAEQDSRYLATFVQPTLSETATRPRRLMITVLAVTFIFIGWLSLVLIGYSNRDRH
ncbi:sugar transporter [Paracoccus binzhouensis]|uniref:sugar transporter n=1 Tax=Paracoccus binzhouensis TaxID=2796149 RepID=UPI0018EF0041|nr:sugar transporter [Paracoccus binzhouensis]